MAKIYYPEHIARIQGKVCKKDPNGLTYCRAVSGKNYVQHRHVGTYKPTAMQEEVNARFKTAQAAVKTIMEDPAQIKNYHAQWKANPGKYSTLRGYIFAKEFAKLA